MRPVIDLSAVRSAFRPMSSALEADGYRLAVSSTPGADHLRVEVVAGPDACEDCLIPKSMFEKMLETALDNAGMGNPRLEVVYPTEAPGATT